MAARVKTIKQRVVVPAPPGTVYKAFVTPKLHAAFTNSPATGSGRVGGKFTAWDGYISGVNRELEPGKRIVQSWRTTEWPPGAVDSELDLMFTAVKGGTEIRMVHSNVPAGQADSYKQGWIDCYWTPLKKYFTQG